MAFTLAPLPGVEAIFSRSVTAEEAEIQSVLDENLERMDDLYFEAESKAEFVSAFDTITVSLEDLEEVAVPRHLALVRYVLKNEILKRIIDKYEPSYRSYVGRLYLLEVELNGRLPFWRRHKMLTAVGSLVAAVVVVNASCYFYMVTILGATPLHLIAGNPFSTSDEIKHELGICERTTDINALDNKGNTALHYAVCTGRDDFVKILVEQGADPKITNKDGLTPQAHAEELGWKGTADLFKRPVQQSSSSSRTE